MSFPASRAAVWALFKTAFTVRPLPITKLRRRYPAAARSDRPTLGADVFRTAQKSLCRWRTQSERCLIVAKQRTPRGARHDLACRPDRRLLHCHRKIDAVLLKAYAAGGQVQFEMSSNQVPGTMAMRSAPTSCDHEPDLGCSWTIDSHRWIIMILLASAGHAYQSGRRPGRSGSLNAPLRGVL